MLIHKDRDDASLKEMKNYRVYLLESSAKYVGIGIELGVTLLEQ